MLAGSDDTMKRLILTLSGALALAAVLSAPGCSFGPDEYSGPFIDEPPPPDEMPEGTTAGAAGAEAATVGGAGGDAPATAGAGGA